MFVSPAFAQDWRIASVDTTDGAVFLIDWNSVSKLSGNIRTIDVLTVLSEKAADRYNIDPATLTQSSYDCSANSVQDAEESYYDIAGKAIRSVGLAHEWREIAPQSNLALVAEAVCGRRGLGENYRIGYGLAIPVAQAREYIRKNYGI